MASLGAVIGRQIGIRPQEQTDWTVVPNQWCLLIGRPGLLKSPAIQAALSPLQRLDALSDEQYRLELSDYGKHSKVAKLRAETGQKVAKVALAKDINADVSKWLDLDEALPPTTASVGMVRVFGCACTTRLFRCRPLDWQAVCPRNQSIQA